jgi:hypothetical protein
MDADTLANIDRLTAQVARLKGQLEAAEIANGLAAKERDAARDRIAVLEDALHDFAANYDCDEGVPVCRACKAKAVLEAPAKEHCPRRLMGEKLAPHMPCDTGDHSKDAKSAETPAPTCKWCNRPPREGDNVCETCRVNMASMSSFPLAPVARDASVDAPPTDVDLYEARKPLRRGASWRRYTRRRTTTGSSHKATVIAKAIRELAKVSP